LRETFEALARQAHNDLVREVPATVIVKFAGT